MSRIAVVALLLWPTLAHAQGVETWYNYQNTGGLAPVILPGGGACFLYSSAAFDVQCYTSIPSTFVTGLYNQQFQDAALGLLPQEPIIGTGFTNGSICAVDDPGDTRTVLDLCAVPVVDSGAGTKLVSRVISNGVGQLASATSIGLASDMTEVAGNLTQADYPWVSRATNAPANAVDMGALASGVNEQTTSAGVATPLTYQCVAGDVQFGAASNGGLAQDSNLFWDNTNKRLGIGLSVPAYPLDILFANSGASGFHVKNSTNGGTAQVQNVLENSGGSLAYYGIAAPSYAGFAPLNSGRAFFGSYLTETSIFTQTLKSIDFYVNSVHVGDWNTSAQFVVDGLGSAMTKSVSGALTPAVAGTDYQAPLTACTDYVSVGCQTGATDIGGTNATTTVIGAENDATMRGDFLATNIAAPATPSAGHGRVYVDSTSTNLCVKDSAGTVKHGVQSRVCPANKWLDEIDDDGGVVCDQLAFSNLSGSATCAQLPALTGDTHSSAGTCATVTDHVTESSGPTSLAIGSVPDLTNYDDVLVRGPGVSSVVGRSVNLLSVAKQHDWFVDGNIMGSSCYIAHNGNGCSATTPTLYAGDHLVNTVLLQVTVIGNSLTGGTFSFGAIGGSIASPSSICAINITAASGTGVFSCSATTGSTHSNDQYGLFVNALTATGTGNGLTWTATETWE